ncbi:CLUMA_CG004308, isoform A [Clunio marinus]|uniref:CLUMA_CG004308, isoform A n=1 Tax=Clunio marinus TaxID=568069 RepID=A0A1J1HVS0_9DIPT|nr:CLUMA_CG004308, isoform A [Clunio marinus]
MKSSGSSSNMMVKSFLIILMVICLMAFNVNCRPENSSSSDVINVEDTDDEFIIKKPTSMGPAYQQFLDELYRHDLKKAKIPKAKRNAEDDPAFNKLTVESPNEFDIPVKPPLGTNENYDQFLSHLYRKDEAKKNPAQNE